MMGQTAVLSHLDTSKRGWQRRALVAFVGASSLAALAAVSPAAQADEVSPTGKGIAGGALLGGEVVAITESLIGVRQGWAYALGGGLGAVGGGIGGYFIENASNNGQASTYILAGGMALIIPALVLSLNATRYHPSESATEDKPPPGIPADPGNLGGSPVTGPGVVAPPAAGPAAPSSPAVTPGPTSQAAPPPATSLVDLGMAKEVGGQTTGLRLGLPVPDVRPMYTMAEQKAYGLPQHAEVRMPVFRLRF